MEETNCAVYAEIREARTDIVFPFLVNVMKDSRPRKVLDLGCGPGLLLRLAAEKLTGTTFIGCDTARGMRAAAIRHLEELKNVPCIVNNTSDVVDESMDVICHTAVVMTIPAQRALSRFFREIARILTQTGIMLGVETHPCFRENAYQGFKTNFNNRRYLSSGTNFTATLSTQSGQTVSFRDTHRPFSEIFNTMCGAGLRPIFSLEFPDISEAPGSPWLLWGAVKPECPERIVQKYQRLLLRRARLESLS